MNDSSRHAKVVYHVIFDEFDHIRLLYFLEGDGFSSFREVISYSQNELISFGC